MGGKTRPAPTALQAGYVYYFPYCITCIDFRGLSDSLYPFSRQGLREKVSQHIACRKVLLSHLPLLHLCSNKVLLNPNMLGRLGNSGSLAKAMLPWLSAKMVMGGVWLDIFPFLIVHIAPMNLCTQIASLPACVSAMYSASVEERATVAGCLLDQDTAVWGEFALLSEIVQT